MIKEEFSEKGIKALKNVGFPIEYEQKIRMRDDNL